MVLAFGDRQDLRDVVEARQGAAAQGDGFCPVGLTVAPGRCGVGETRSKGLVHQLLERLLRAGLLAPEECRNVIVEGQGRPHGNKLRVTML